MSLAGRLDLATINKTLAYRMVGDGVGVTRERWTTCLRAAGWSEGPLRWRGPSACVPDRRRQELHQLAASEDPVIRDRFQVAPVLWQVATILIRPVPVGGSGREGSGSCHRPVVGTVLGDLPGHPGGVQGQYLFAVIVSTSIAHCTKHIR